MRNLVWAVVVTSLGCAPVDGACGEAPPQTLVIAAWRHLTPDDGIHAPGADLDRTVSPGFFTDCTDAPDFRSPISDTPGIDNQFAAAIIPLLIGTLPVDFQASTLEQNLRGELVLGVEIGDEIDVLVLEPLEPLAPDGSGAAIAGGFEYRELRRFRTVPACLADGQVGLILSALEIPMGVLGSFELADVRIRLMVQGDGSVSRGELGGTLTIPQLTTAIVRAGAPVDEPTVRTLSSPDLRFRSTGTCDGVSFGVALVLAPAVLL